jgi:hypothetical protein
MLPGVEAVKSGIYEWARGDFVNKKTGSWSETETVLL